MRRRLVAFFFAIMTGVSLIMPTAPVYAASSCQAPSFLGMPAWYRGLLERDENGDCTTIKNPGVRIFVLTVALNILQAAMVAVAYVAVGFIIKGGYMYMISTGRPDAVAKAKNTIRDALIGLTIAISAAAIVNMVSGII